ncbi:prepilin-type N-terminal cleavage/methylation domain-containing protein [Roseateles sp.]|uniref:prepilin-type N-terminal cleavage/methylation domain-containing protein n=1 Tax=Roseateles sp. TaxID=1971397 RepID=UPI0025E29EBF|nr:prepilin-type N-terminal cleavage/methylation domain-containing protein [Roseateles sp.]MBV8033813.1 prepilin-type N-terminal cleavage/methylation domain-containing protein [Roseateles sp.]
MQRGFTLLETLVTLVLVALVAGVLFEALYQLGRLEQRLGNGQLMAQTSRLREIWLQETLEGMQAGAKDSSERFRGGARELQGLSSLAPRALADGPQLVELRLRRAPDRDETELLLGFPALDPAAASALVLLHWPGDRGRWLYLDEAGEWQQTWPPALGAAPALPRAIALDRGDDLVVLATLAAPGEALGRRLDKDRLP